MGRPCPVRTGWCILVRGDPGRSRHVHQIALLAGTPFMFGAATALGWWLGSLADRHFHTGVILQAVGAAVGLAAAAVDTARLIKRTAEEDS